MTNNEKIFALAKKYHFDKCGIISTDAFDTYKEHLDEKIYGNDFYINHDPATVDDNAKAIIVLIKSYKPYDISEFLADYAYIDAYYVASNAAYQNAKDMAGDIDEIGYSANYSPRIPYRHCAFRAGFGIRGMNGLLIDKDYGSYINIQCIMTNMSLEYTNHVETVDICQRCDICTSECPNSALLGTGKVIMQNCIRHYIPAKRYIPVNIREKIGRNIIGCDDCKRCCPNNSEVPFATPPNELLEACYLPILLDENHPKNKEHIKILQKHCGKNEMRPQRVLIMAVLLAGNTKDKKYIPLLNNLEKTKDDEMINEYIRWAIDNIEGE